MTQPIWSGGETSTQKFPDELLLPQPKSVGPSGDPRTTQMHPSSPGRLVPHTAAEPGLAPDVMTGVIGAGVGVIDGVRVGVIVGVFVAVGVTVAVGVVVGVEVLVGV